MGTGFRKRPRWLAPRLVLALAAGVALAGLAALLATRGTGQTTPTPPATSAGPLTRAQQLHVAAEAAQRRLPPGMVATVGTHLVADGQPWLFVGFDDYTLTSIAGGRFTCGVPHTAADIDREFERFQGAGVTAVRTWFFQSYVAGTGAWHAFDVVLHAAAKHKIRVIPVLANQWGECENYDGTPSQYKGLAWYTQGYRTTPDYGMPLTYLEYAQAVAAHYRNDVVIAFWQLMNEAEAAPGLGVPCNEPAAGAALRAFGDTVTAAIKARDPYHLVSLGTIGTGQCGTSGTDYQFIHSGRIDICEYHDYTPGAITGDPWNGIKPDLASCDALNKPTFAGEVGIDASITSSWSRSGVVSDASLKQRATLMTGKMDAQFDHGVSGFLIWMAADTASLGYNVGPDDPMFLAVNAASTGVASPAALYRRVNQGAT